MSLVVGASVCDCVSVLGADVSLLLCLLVRTSYLWQKPKQNHNILARNLDVALHVLLVCAAAACLCFVFRAGNYLRRNTVLKELWLAHNDLCHIDAFNIAIVLKANYHLQFLDVSNNKIEVSKMKKAMQKVKKKMDQNMSFRSFVL